MFKTINGRPAKIGSMYWEKDENGFHKRKFTISYCECGKKIGLTPDELRTFAENMPGLIPEFISRLFRVRIFIPK